MVVAVLFIFRAIYERQDAMLVFRSMLFTVTGWLRQGQRNRMSLAR